MTVSFCADQSLCVERPDIAETPLQALERLLHLLPVGPAELAVDGGGYQTAARCLPTFRFSVNASKQLIGN